MKPYIKYFIISAAIALTACNAGGEKVTTASQTTAASETTSETETVTETVSAPDKTEGLIESVAETTGTEESLVRECVQKITDFAENPRKYNDRYTNGEICLFDFNADGFPEVCFYGHDMLAPYLNVFDISGDKPVFMGGTNLGMCPLNINGSSDCISLYYDRSRDEYFYYSCVLCADSGGTLETINTLTEYVTPVNFGDSPQFSFEPTASKTFKDTSESGAYIAEAFEKLSDHIHITCFHPAEKCGMDLEEQLSSFFYYIDCNTRRAVSYHQTELLLNEKGVNGVTLGMTCDEVMAALGGPDSRTNTSDYDAPVPINEWVYNKLGKLTFEENEDGEYVLHSFSFNSFSIEGITENSTRSELIAALEDMRLFPEAEWRCSSLGETERITLGIWKWTSLIFHMDGENIEYVSASAYSFY